MKTPKEIKEFLNNKTFNQEDTRTIRAIIKSKNYEGINVINGGIPNCKLIEFIEWFENKPKEGNQDTITFDGKEYEFIECDYLSCCGYCDLGEPDSCTLSPRICSSNNRRDRKEGYFKLIKPKNLELIGGEFYKDVYKGETAVISIIDKQTKWDNDYVHTTHSLIIDFKKNHILTCSGRITIDYFKKHYSLATPEEKQLLIDKVEKETDKVWNEQTKSFEDKPKDILVPECINIYTNNNLDTLGISFNNDLQILAFRKEFSIYEVFANTIMWEKIDCKLVKTLFSDLKVGDIFVNSFALFDNLLTELDGYLIKLSEENICFIQDSNCVITSFYDLEDCAIQKVDFYKVVPINN